MTRRLHPSAPCGRAARQQRGIVIIVALVVLVAMSLAGLALLRSVGATQSIAGNLAFRQNATSAADRGIEAGWAWIMTEANNKNLNAASQGYYAQWNGGVTGTDDFDPYRYDWGPLGNASNTKSREVTPTGGDDGTGNRVQVIVHRLCRNEGEPGASGQECVIVPAAMQAGEGGGGAGASQNIGASLVKRPYYRVTARVEGPRNTVSFVQVILF